MSPSRDGTVLSTASSSTSPPGDTTSDPSCSTYTAQTSVGSRQSSPSCRYSSTTPDPGVPGLTREALSYVADYLDHRDKIKVAGVCKAWRNALLSNTSLWRHLDVHLPSRHVQTQLDFYAQSDKAVEKLHVDVALPADADDDDIYLCADALRSVIQTPCVEDVGRITIALLASRAACVYVLWNVLPCLVDDDRFLALRELCLRLGVARLRLGGNFFAFTADLATLSIAGDITTFRHPVVDDVALADLRPRRPAMESADYVLNARVLRLCSVVLDRELEIPLAPRLQVLHLKAVVMGHNFFRLLDQAPELRELKLYSVTLDGDGQHGVNDVVGDDDLDDYDDQTPPRLLEEEEQEEEEDDDDDDDDDDHAFLVPSVHRYRRRRRRRLRPIVLHRLTSFECTGPHTPCVWRGSDRYVAYPELRMPNLQRATLVDLPDLDLEMIAPPDLSRWMAAEDEARAGDVDVLCDPLFALCSSSTFLIDLDISGTSMGDLSLPDSVQLCPRLRRLCVANCSSLSDAFVQMLFHHAPALEELDVRDCVDVTAVGVAVAVERYLDRGLGGLKRIWLDDPGPLNCFTPALDGDQYWAAKAYDWLRWLDVVVEWEEVGQARKELKRPTVATVAEDLSEAETM